MNKQITVLKEQRLPLPAQDHASEVKRQMDEEALRAGALRRFENNDIDEAEFLRLVGE